MSSDSNKADEAPVKGHTISEKTADSKIDDESIPFHCKSCGLHETVHYFGQQPAFVYGVVYTEPTYIMKDPFQPPVGKWKSKPEYFIALGAHCIRCNDVVCKDNGCHFFFKHTYCIPCVKIVISTFPTDIQLKIKKQLSTGQ
ncbi:cysteine-rich DPF motif domain-containing protein 1 [Stomoxys calcitrans]|uniref:Cysteine-rich DPF motif domain-containing protein 1 n=1 Tax=Stomoxys calcitrans TaxID=35570 RepID=A0A1I8PK56_STOCA|nr:cysteine-rich DPF motif domain-containing protein 1 [Stomoxys calcitrans]